MHKNLKLNLASVNQETLDDKRLASPSYIFKQSSNSSRSQNHSHRSAKNSYRSPFISTLQSVKPYATQKKIIEYDRNNLIQVEQYVNFTHSSFHCLAKTSKCPMECIFFHKFAKLMSPLLVSQIIYVNTVNVNIALILFANWGITF